MIDDKTKILLNNIGELLGKELDGFYGRVTFNFQNGKYVNANIEQSIINLKERKKE